jgi:hypothetical protein
MTIALTTAAELHAHLGGIPLERIRMVPPPGQATEQDLLRVLDLENLTCELIDGVLVEKTRDFYAALVTTVLGFFLGNFLD